MSNIVNDLVEKYIRDVLPNQNGLLKEMEEYADTNHVPIVQPEVAKLLEVLMKIHNPKKILEVGTAIGYSALILSFASRESHITTIERRTDRIDTAKEYIKRAARMDSIEILEGNAEEILLTLENKYDVIFLDAAKGQYMNFLSSSIEKLNSGGILISDNVLYKGMIASNEYVIRRKKTIVKRMRSYIDYIMNHKDLTTSLIPIGDGVAISYKK
ncbi:O-methyltransferase [Lutibacter sp. B2]|nr:O-methyltransferase [Lutibacter sp. B2]